MPKPNQTNWRAIPAFNSVYDSITDCVKAAVSEFSHRQRVSFVILRGQVKPIWAVMPFVQYRHLPPDAEINPCVLCFFGTFRELREIALTFPPDLFSSLPAPDSPEADAYTDFTSPPHFDTLVKPPDHTSPPETEAPPSEDGNQTKGDDTADQTAEASSKGNDEQ